MIRGEAPCARGSMLQLTPEGLDLADAMSRPVSVCGQRFIADNSGALYWPSQRALLVADLPLANGGMSGANGLARSLRQTLIKLAEGMDRDEPATVTVLGEGVHANNGAPYNGAAAGMASEDLQVLRILQEDRDWIWINGGADHPTAMQLGGSTCGELRLAGITLRPRPTQGWATHEIAASV